jgi:biopolymer transport protein TolQ
MRRVVSIARPISGGGALLTLEHRSDSIPLPGVELIAALIAAASSGLDVWSLVLNAGPMAKFVLFVLTCFSVISWGITAERFRRFRRAEQQSRTFLERFGRGGPLPAIHDDTAELTAAPQADVFRAVFREVSLNPLAPGATWHGAELEALERVMRRSTSAQLSELERSLGFLATTASATPFIGLFGTVWGIMNAFRGIGVAGNASLAAYAPGIAEALVATAAGLAAAIPAVLFYNHFLGRLRAIEARVDEFAADLIHCIQGRRL